MNPIRHRLFFIMILAAALPMAAAALSVRVDPAGGAPRLTVNGKPVRARIFWGGPGTSPIPLKPEWAQSQFEFTAAAGSDHGTMHLRFGHTPGEITLDDIQVIDLDASNAPVLSCDFEGGPQSFARDWTFWPPGAANTVATVRVAPGAGHQGSAGLHIQLKSPPTGPWPDFHVYSQARLKLIEGHRYRVTFRARATPARNLSLAFYEPGQTFQFLGGPQDCFEAQIKLAAGVGVDLVSFPLGMPWPAPGRRVDWRAIDAACQKVLKANPKALLIPRVGMDPPPWWRQAYPDDVMQWEDDRRAAAVVASPRYRHDAAERLAALIEHLEAKFGEQIAGYHPTGQNTGEWFYHDTWKKELNGYAPADLAGWRQWLQKNYGTDAALAKAWGDPAATCVTAAVPTAQARHAAPAGVFRDPLKERALIDWAEFQQQAMAECVCDLARAARQASHGQKLILFFYGYLFEFAAVQNGPATAGHYALRRVLDSPDIDVLCSPISYTDRGVGQSAPSMTAAESVALTGKMWLNEDDTHTYLASGDPPGSRDHVTTLEATNHELARNVAQEALRNFATWWMDLGSSGWFNDPGMWALMKRLAVLDEALLAKPTPFNPEVAAVIDERAMLRVAAGGTAVTGPGIYEARAALGRMGAPYGQYLLDDVMAGRVHAKLYVVLNAWVLSAAERAKLAQSTRGATVIWCYAPGAFDEQGASLEAMRQLTGFAMKPVESKRAWATPTASGKQLGLTKPLGALRPVRPLFAIAASGDEMLATWPDGSAAVALRRSPEGTSLFAGAPGLTPELLRLAARAAGVHLFTETDCNVYANGDFVAVHAAQDGPLTLDLGRPGKVADMLSGEELGTGPRITLTIKRGETRILRY